jgi:hypothetical protein
VDGSSPAAPLAAHHLNEQCSPRILFDHGLYRLIREHVDPERREREGPVRVDEPRVDRTVERMGPGQPVDGG